MKKHMRNGFTLIELLVALAIVAVLAAVALPNYSKHVRTGKLTEATSTLASLRVDLEQYYQDHHNYGSTASACGVTMPTGKYFGYSCNWGAGATNQGYTITATAAATSGIGTVTYTVDQGNSKQTTAFPNTSGLPRACWISTEGGTC